MGRIATIPRRTALFGALALAGGVAFGWWRYVTPGDNPLEPRLAEGEVTLNPFVLVNAEGVTVVTPRAEMGQGVHSTLAALVAEEMDLDWSAVRVMHGPPSSTYYNSAAFAEALPFLPTDRSWLAEMARGIVDVPGKFVGMQMTGGSSSVADGYNKMRLAGAAARASLVEAAARQLGIAAAQLTTEGGAVVAPDGTRLAYTELAAEAAKVQLSGEPKLKPREQWKLLGTSPPRLDMVPKVTGTATFAIDFRLPGMRFATVKANPHLGAKMIGADTAAAAAMPGVDKIVPLANGVAVVAATTWHAMQAAETISFEWAPATYPQSSDAIRAELAASFSEARRDSVPRNEGNVDEALKSGDVFEAEYSVPYLAHAPLEPQSAAALFKDGKLEVWAGNQIPNIAVAAAAKATGIEPADVTFHTLLMGGSFGRRLEMDTVEQAAIIAKANPGTPILLTWTREEDMTHDFYRPAALARVRGKVEGGRLVAFDYGVASSSVTKGQMGRLGFDVPGPDSLITQGAWDQPYSFANHRVTGYRAPDMVPVSSWRSVGASLNGFFHESAIDELAHKAGADPLEFRLRHIEDETCRKVLETVAELSGWGTAPAGGARGLAFCHAFGVPAAEVIEVEQTADGIRITGAWAAVDVGIALDPRNIASQVEGAMVFGLSAAIRGAITIADGKVEQTNFWDYEPLRLNQWPGVEVKILENAGRIKGIGEPGVPPAAPALANAIFALTGQRIRDLPLGNAIQFA